MSGFRRKEKTRVIRSAEDLSDSRARGIMESYKLSAEEIFPLYRSLEAELIAMGGTIEKDFDEIPGFVRRLACGAIVAYELESQGQAKFVDEGKIATIKRTKAPNVYGSIGRYYEGTARRLNAGEF